MIFATEKSKDLYKWCILLCHGLVSLSLNFLPPNDVKKYLNRIEYYCNSNNNNVMKETSDFSDFDEKKALQNEEEVSSNDEKKALVSSEQQENLSATTLDVVPPPISTVGQISLKRYEKQISDLKDKYRPRISSPLNPNRQPSKSNSNVKDNNEDDIDGNLSKRYSTLANSRPKRTQTAKLISSAAIYRFFNQKSNILAKSSSDPEEFHYVLNKELAENSVDGDDNDKNIKLNCNRPTFHQQPRKSHTNLSPAVTLQLSRKCLKLMVRIKRHRNTI